MGLDLTNLDPMAKELIERNHWRLFAVKHLTDKVAYVLCSPKGDLFGLDKTGEYVKEVEALEYKLVPIARPFWTLTSTL